MGGGGSPPAGGVGGIRLVISPIGRADGPGLVGPGTGRDVDLTRGHSFFFFLHVQGWWARAFQTDTVAAATAGRATGIGKEYRTEGATRCSCRPSGLMRAASVVRLDPTGTRIGWRVRPIRTQDQKRKRIAASCAHHPLPLGIKTIFFHLTNVLPFLPLPQDAPWRTPRRTASRLPLPRPLPCPLYSPV